MTAFWHGRLRRAVAGPVIARLGSRPWWKWLLITLLVLACLTVTVLYATTLALDVSRQHWAAAVDASREAVLAVVCWAAVIIVLSAESRSAGGSASRGDALPNGQPDADAWPESDSLHRAQLRVHRLRAQLDELAAARDRAGSGADPDLDREVASTTARLERARQWLSSAQAALTARRRQQQHQQTAGATEPGRRARRR
jgi:hypothetical protein